MRNRSCGRGARGEGVNVLPPCGESRVAVVVMMGESENILLNFAWNFFVRSLIPVL